MDNDTKNTTKVGTKGTKFSLMFFLYSVCKHLVSVVYVVRVAQDSSLWHE